jgi:sec-independent protein translocase protein TatC
MSEHSSTPDEGKPESLDEGKPESSDENKSELPGKDKAESLISHLIEMRDRLLRSVIVVLIVFIPAAIFSGKLFTLLAAPMLSALTTDGTMISTEVAGPFLVPLKFAFALSIAVAIPYLLYQIWSFIAPGLYDNEKRLAFPLLLSSTLLFYCGIAFAYFVVFPIMFSFFPSVAPEGIEVTPDINHYLGFVLKLFFAFGIAFEMPIATILLIKAGITTREKLAKKRQYVVLGAFVLGMLLTPPDIFSQTMLAIPMWLLFELGLIMSAFVGGPKKPDDEDPDDDGEPVVEKTPSKTDAQSKSSASGKTENPDEEDVIEPAVMPQQANANEDDDADIEEEEDIDKLAEELDDLEDITDWLQQEEKPAKKTKKAKKSAKAKKKKSKKAKKSVKRKKTVKTKKA